MTMMMFSLLMTFLTTRNNNTRRFHSILNTFRFFLLIRGSPQKTLILVVKIKIKCQSSSEIFKFGLLFRIITEDKNTNHGINVSAREDRSVRRLFDATRDRTRRMGREFGTSSRVYIHFLFLFVYYYAKLCVLFLCVSVLVFFILEFDRRAP
jgi:hypothetical protein